MTKNYYATEDGCIYISKKEYFRKLKTYSLNGYQYVSVRRDDGRYHRELVHRLIARTFIPNVDNKQFVDHINTNRSDNRVSNLRWVTQQENSNNELSLLNYLKANRKKAKSEFCYSPDIIPEEIKDFSNPQDVLNNLIVGQIYKIPFNVANAAHLRSCCVWSKRKFGHRYKTVKIEDEECVLIKKLK